MAENTPFFSIMMPTRNRAHLLPYALQSALDQSFSDYEIVVSNNFSSDQTEQVVRNMRTERVRYFRTEKLLPIHESFEFVLDKTRGDWIVYVADDDALYPQALAKIFEAIQSQETEVISWRLAGLFLDTHPYRECRGRALLHQATGRAMKVSSRAQLEKVFALGPLDPVTPRIQNSCCHRSVVEKVKRQLGRFFLPPSPDYTGCAAMLAQTETFAFIDQDLTMVGDGAKTPGYSPSYGEASEHPGLSEDFGGEQMFKFVPLNQLTDYNWIAECLLTVKHAMPEEFSGIEIAWDNYFIRCFFGLLLLETSGFFSSTLRKEYYAALAKQPPAVRARVRRAQIFLSARFLLQRPAARRWVVRLGLPEIAYHLFRRRKYLIIGRDGGFKNILDAIHYANGPGFVERTHRAEPAGTPALR